MTRRKSHLPRSTSHSGRSRWGWAGIALWLLLAGLPLALSAQNSKDPDGDSQDSSQHVEESEEAFRRRMELEEAANGTDVVPDRTAAGVKAAEGIDALPFESRKHLRDEMRNVIIEQGEWTPEDANAIYPYHPSAAAEKDPELRQKEEKAWGELVQEYHKREAAALAGGGGRSNGTGAGQNTSQGGGQAGGQNSSPAAASASNSSASQSSRSQSSRSPDSRPEADAAGSTAASAGVSQSALEYLKHQTGAATGGQSGSQPAGNSGLSSGQASEPVAQSSSAMSSASAAASKSPAEQQQKLGTETAAAQPSAAKKAESSDTEPPPPPGSVAIAELAALENAEKAKAADTAAASAKSEPAADTTAKPDAGSSASTPSNTAVLRASSEQDSPPPRPGTIAIPELEKLQGLDQEVASLTEKADP